MNKVDINSKPFSVILEQSGKVSRCRLSKLDKYCKPLSVTWVDIDIKSSRSKFDNVDKYCNSPSLILHKFKYSCLRFDEEHKFCKT